MSVFLLETKLSWLLLKIAGSLIFVGFEPVPSPPEKSCIAPYDKKKTTHNKNNNHKLNTLEAKKTGFNLIIF